MQKHNIHHQKFVREYEERIKEKSGLMSQTSIILGGLFVKSKIIKWKGVVFELSSKDMMVNIGGQRYGTEKVTGGKYDKKIGISLTLLGAGHRLNSKGSDKIII